LFTYCQSFPNFCKHRIVISITVISHERFEYTRMPSHICQCVISVVILHIRRGTGLFMKFSVGTHCVFNNLIYCYYSNTMIITMLMCTLISNYRFQNKLSPYFCIKIS
jgi:hypothetical protein